MGNPFQGSICLSDLIEAQKENHSAIATAGKNGKVYVSCTMWENDTIDQFGNTHSLQVNPKKDTPDKKFYIGNFKPNK